VVTGRDWFFKGWVKYSLMAWFFRADEVFENNDAYILSVSAKL